MAAWIATLKSWRGMTSLSFAARCASPALGLAALDDAGKGVDRFGVHQHVELDHVRLAVAGVLVIHGAVAARDAFDPVVEINQDFVRAESCWSA